MYICISTWVCMYMYIYIYARKHVHPSQAPFFGLLRCCPISLLHGCYKRLQMKKSWIHGDFVEK